MPYSVDTTASGSATRLTWRGLASEPVDGLAMGPHSPHEGAARSSAAGECWHKRTDLGRFRLCRATDPVSIMRTSLHPPTWSFAHDELIPIPRLPPYAGRACSRGPDRFF